MIGILPEGFLATPSLVARFVSGLLQVVFAMAIVVKRPITRGNMMFALFFGVNGLAFSFRNLAPHQGYFWNSVQLPVWGYLNWVATAALVVFGVCWPRRPASSEKWRYVLAAVVAVSFIPVEVWTARLFHVGALVFGGSGAVYVATAFILLLLPLRFGTELDRTVGRQQVMVAAILVVNSALHAGAGLGPGDLKAAAGPSAGFVSAAVHAGILCIMAVLWLLQALLQQFPGHALSLRLFSKLTFRSPRSIPPM